MHVFVSAGEPSGDLHGANLIRALRQRRPEVRVSGFGGPRMADAGAELLYPLTDLALMWFGRVIAHLPTFFKLARQTEVYFRSKRPDAVVLIDYPGFHWALAKRAHRAGIPVYYFVPPQLWAWAGWRVSKMRRWVTTVLTALPFEDAWYRDRGVNTHYVGHPYFDEIAEQVNDAEFVAKVRAGGPLVALLPGSRNQEVAENFPLMLAAAAKVHAAVPAVRFAVASFNERQAKVAREKLTGTGLPAEVHVGRTPDIIEACDVAVSVSGSVGFELMARLKPTVVVYKVGRMLDWVGRRLATCQYMSLVNLVADAPIFPEFPGAGWPDDAIAGHVVAWLKSPESRNGVVEQLRELRSRVAVPGASARAAEYLIQAIPQVPRAPRR
jgi:lipid-A-disaccharide synthase